LRRFTTKVALPSTTTLSATVQVVLMMTRRRSATISWTVQTAVTVSPIRTGAVKPSP
jgi:hypothetical protein